MLLAYVHCLGPEAPFPELCLIPERPDQFSYPVRVDALIQTDAAVVRLSCVEAVKVEIDPRDNGKIIEPVIPSKLYLTPSQPDRPGIVVRKVKVIKIDQMHHRTYFLGEAKDADWKEWMPNKSQL
jgi:hypothetical protein